MKLSEKLMMEFITKLLKTVDEFSPYDMDSSTQRAEKCCSPVVEYTGTTDEDEVVEVKAPEKEEFLVWKRHGSLVIRDEFVLTGKGAYLIIEKMQDKSILKSNSIKELIKKDYLSIMSSDQYSLYMKDVDTRTRRQVYMDEHPDSTSSSIRLTPHKTRLIEMVNQMNNDDKPKTSRGEEIEEIDLTKGDINNPVNENSLITEEEAQNEKSLQENWNEKPVDKFFDVVTNMDSVSKKIASVNRRDAKGRFQKKGNI